MRVTICGGGNAAHIFLGLLKKQNIFVNLYLPYQDEAMKWNDNMKILDNGLEIKMPDNSVIYAKPDGASKDPSIVKDSDLLLLPIPSYAHENTIKNLVPYLKENAILGALPGNSGFHWLADKLIHKDGNRKDITIFGSNQLPLNCRFIEYAKSAHLLGIKKHVKIATIPDNKSDTITSLLNNILSPITFDSLPHFLAINLYPSNQVIHMSRLYDLFKDWKQGITYSESPLFYAGFNNNTIKYAEGLSNELQKIAKAVDECADKEYNESNKTLPKPPHIYPHVVSIHEAMKIYYGDMIEDNSTLINCFLKNSGYVGLRSPTKEIKPGEHIPDFTNRYFSEDLPHSLCLAKGIADLVNCPTPLIDTITYWAQEHMNKEYIIDGHLTGKNANETPLKVYGVDSLGKLLHGF